MEQNPIRELLIRHYGEAKYGAGFVAPTGVHRYGQQATIPRDCPWIDPPEWFLDSYGLEAWGDLLTVIWEEEAPRKLARRRSLFSVDKVMRAADQERTDLAIALLTGEAGD